MHTRARSLLAVVAVTLLSSVPSGAQERAGLMGDLIRDVDDVQQKLVALAREFPADKQGWRPSEGTRSVGEVLLHLASDNYLLPAFVGVKPDPATGIDPADYSTLTTYERRQIPRDSVIAELDRSFAHLRNAMLGLPDSRMDEKVTLFGQEMSVRRVMLLTTGHLHEHLGQMIAYARSNDIVPPWSRPASGN